MQKKTKAKKTQKTQATDSKLWRSYPLKTYSDFMSNSMFHFSSKSCNSSIKTGSGIRVDRKNAARLPKNLLSVSLSHSESGVSTDYIRDAKESSIFSQIAAVLEGKEKVLYTNIISDEVEHIRKEQHLLENPKKENLDLSAKNKQLLFPLNGDYVSITPLHSSGFSKLLREHIKQWDDEKEELAKIEKEARSLKFKMAIFPIGGDQPQNVGKNAFLMQKVPVFNVPKENQDIRIGLAKIFSRLRTHLSKNDMLKLRDFYVTNEFHSGVGTTSMIKRNEEIELLSSLCKIAILSLKRVEDSLAILVNHNISFTQDEVAEELNSSSENPALKLGLLFPELRDSNWVSLVKDHIIETILNFEILIDGRKEQLPVAARNAMIAFSSPICKMVQESFNV